ncbi:MAG: hypothetical protein AB7T49_21000 [Oligoflexales bacterium]
MLVRKLGVGRQHYYDIKQAIKEDGIEGLLEKTPKCHVGRTAYLLCIPKSLVRPLQEH